MLWIHISGSECLGGLQSSTRKMVLICDTVSGHEGTCFDVTITLKVSDGFCAGQLYTHITCDIHASVCKTVSSLGQLCCLLACSCISISFDFEIEGQIFLAQFSNAKAVLTCTLTQQSCYISEWVGCRILCSCPNVHLDLVFLKLSPQFQS